MAFSLGGFNVHSFPQEITLNKSQIVLDSRGTKKHSLGSQYTHALLHHDGNGTIAVQLFEFDPSAPKKGDRVPEGFNDDTVVYEIHVRNSKNDTGKASSYISCHKLFVALRYAPKEKLRAAYKIEQSDDGHTFVVFKLPRFGVDKMSDVDAEVVDEDDDVPAPEITEDEIKQEIHKVYGAGTIARFDDICKAIHKKDDSILKDTIKSILVENLGARDMGSGNYRLEPKGKR